MKWKNKTNDKQRTSDSPGFFFIPIMLRANLFGSCSGIIPGGGSKSSCSSGSN